MLSAKQKKTIEKHANDLGKQLAELATSESECLDMLDHALKALDDHAFEIHLSIERKLDLAMGVPSL